MYYIACKNIIISFVLVLMPFVGVSAQEHEESDTPVYTVAEAVEMIEQGLKGQEVYVKGIVSRVVSGNVAADGWITYDISDDGKRKSQQLRLLRNYKGAGNEKWASISEIGVKDNVIVFGKLDKAITNVDNTWSLEYESYLVEHNRFSPIPMESEIVDFTDVYYGETANKYINTYSGMSFDAVFEKGTSSSTPEYYISDSSVRLYKYNSICIKSMTADLISKIEIVYTNKSNSDSNPKVSQGKTVYVSNNVLMWDLEVPAAEATLTVGNNSRITSITVYYAPKVDNVYTRDVTPGKVGTICLPYAVEAGDFSGARCYETDYVGDGKVYFSEVYRLEAGMPYIFFANEDATKIVAKYSGEAVTEAKSKNGLHGTFERISISESDNIVVLSNNHLVLCGNNSSLAANRAYLKIEEIAVEPTHNNGAKRVSFNLDGTPTNLDGISLFSTSSSNAVYNITGQRVHPTAKGILIKNGRKFINHPSF